ncbi:MAG TPA: hypothetical protein VM598_08155 [Bdellovibrionota bacterium]|nr:hypothetical protein [Bdellovibrionota bacterium]
MKRQLKLQVLSRALVLLVLSSSASAADIALRVNLGPSDYLKDDSLGDYIQGVDYVRALLQDLEGFGFGSYYPSKGSPTPIRHVYYNLNYPVPGGGGTPKGLVGSDPRSNHTHVCTPDGSLVANIPPGTTVTGAYSDTTFLINGVSHRLIFGNGCHNVLPSPGTSTFTITRNLDGTWTFSLPEGSVGALWKAKGPGLVFVGNYYFGAAINAQLK